MLNPQRRDGKPSPGVFSTSLLQSTDCLFTNSESSSGGLQNASTLPCSRASQSPLGLLPGTGHLSPLSSVVRAPWEAMHPGRSMVRFHQGLLSRLNLENEAECWRLPQHSKFSSTWKTSDWVLIGGSSRERPGEPGMPAVWEKPQSL